MSMMSATLNGAALAGENCQNTMKAEVNNSSLEIEHSTESDEFLKNWGFNINDLYALGTTFFKEKEGKAFHLSYKDRISLVAFTQQVIHGKFNPEKSQDVGYLDIIGRNRREAWAALGNMSSKDAKIGFIKLLDNLCPIFRPFVLARKCDMEEKIRRKKAEEEERKRELEEMERLKLEEEAKLQVEKEQQKELQQKHLIQEALNKQTFHQFKAYAEQQCPGDLEQQAVLIRQLQEQHYQQYMAQVLSQQLAKCQNNSRTVTDMAPESENNDKAIVPPPQSSGETTEEEIETASIATASMWTRKDIQEFKENIRKEGGDGIIKVGHGETVTVRVPTHSDGTCLFWEFATDSFDIGFGVYFEWTKNPDTQVSVHISESEDDEDEDDDAEQTPCDIEKGVQQSDKPPLSVIIPIYRRDCHEEVYSGSHIYPGQGVYLLKFDNSYSLWRSKTLYYRVYYTR